jgi:hypothetical protein
MKKHDAFCNCYDCKDIYIKELQTKAMKPYLVDSTGRTDYADVISKPASYYLDSTLVAKVPVTMYSSPDDKSPIVMKFPKGANVGTIFSYVVRNGQVWWDMDWFSGKHAGFVKHAPELFNYDIAEQTSTQKQYDDIKKEIDKPNVIENVGNSVLDLTNGASKALSGVGDSLSFLGENLKWIIIGVVVVVIIYAVLKLKSA